MFWLIETQDQFDRFKLEAGKELFMLPIYKHPEMHPGLYAPLCLYVYDLENEKDYMINFSHSQALSFDILQVKDWIKIFPDRVYVPDRKAFHHFAFSSKTCDLNLVSIPDLKSNNHTINYYTQRFYDDPDLNNIVPIVKHFEYSQETFQAYKSIIKKYQPNQYHNDISDVFWFIEKNGLKVNTAFERYFDLKRPFLSRHNSWVLTQYNLNTTTGRPSNTFNGLNFAALNKDNQSRSVFIPRNDFLMEIDLTAYHPTLIAQIVGYESPTGDIYEDFALKYGMDRTEAKGLVFKQLYGHIFDQYKDFEFFQLTSLLIQKIWKTFEGTGKYVVSETGKIFSKSELPNMNPQKLFNYIIQHWETYNNVALLKEILYIIYSKETKIVLYTYDALLLDASKEDKQVIKEILNVFEQNKLRVKISYGSNYDTLQNL